MYNRNENQKEEIETIKPRSLTLNLSDADVDRITEQAESHGLTVSQLLENFIGDLVSGTYSNGSDERERATSWFERCWFGMFPDNTFLRYLIEWGYIDEFLGTYDFMVDMKDDIEITLKEENPDAEEIASYREDATAAEAELKDFYKQYTDDVHEETPESYEDALKSVLDYKERLEKFKGVE